MVKLPVLRGYRVQQRKKAYAIRNKVIDAFPWELNKQSADLILLELIKIKNPTFFIKNEHSLYRGEIESCLNQYKGMVNDG
jgi:hypothetical protein